MHHCSIATYCMIEHSQVVSSEPDTDSAKISHSSVTMQVAVCGAQDHHHQRRRKHSQMNITSNEAEELRQSSLPSCDSNLNAKRQCLENAAVAPAQALKAVDMPAAPACSANDGHSTPYAQKGDGGPTTALRLRGGGPTASEESTPAAAPAARRTRAAAAAASSFTPASASASASSSKQARPPPPRPHPSRPAGGAEERAPLLGTPRVPVPPSSVVGGTTDAAPIPIPPAPRRPAAASRPAGNVAVVAAAASDSAPRGGGGGGDAPSEPNASAQPADNNNDASGSGMGNGNRDGDRGDGIGDGSGGGDGGDGGNNNVEERPPTVAVLNIRCPVPPPPSPKPLAQQLQQFPGQQQPQQPQQHNMNKARPMPRDGPIVKVLVPTSGGNAMTERQLGRCIVQATGIGIAPPTADGGGWGWHWDLGYDPYVQYGRTGGGADGNDGSAEPPLAGLFRRDGLFMPMSYVLANALALQGELLSITRPVSRPRPPPPPPPIWPYVVGGLFVASIMAKYGVDWDWLFGVTLLYAELAVRFLINLPFQLFNVLVEIPLKETYRHGPSFIGWEGQPLPRICAQVTFHGDEAFWSRNMLECEKIYAAKEAAALHIRKPLLYIAIAAGLFFAIQSLVRTNAIRRQYRPDRNMVETYNALNILLRQFNRAGGAMGIPRR